MYLWEHSMEDASSVDGHRTPHTRKESPSKDTSEIKDGPVVKTDTAGEMNKLLFPPLLPEGPSPFFCSRDRYQRGKRSSRRRCVGGNKQRRALSAPARIFFIEDENFENHRVQVVYLEDDEEGTSSELFETTEKSSEGSGTSSVPAVSLLTRRQQKNMEKISTSPANMTQLQRVPLTHDDDMRGLLLRWKHEFKSKSPPRSSTKSAGAGNSSEGNAEEAMAASSSCVYGSSSSIRSAGGPRGLNGRVKSDSHYYQTRQCAKTDCGNANRPMTPGHDTVLATSSQCPARSLEVICDGGSNCGHSDFLSACSADEDLSPCALELDCGGATSDLEYMHETETVYHSPRPSSPDLQLVPGETSSVVGGAETDGGVLHPSPSRPSSRSEAVGSPAASSEMGAFQTSKCCAEHVPQQVMQASSQLRLRGAVAANADLQERMSYTLPQKKFVGIDGLPAKVPGSNNRRVLKIKTKLPRRARSAIERGGDKRLLEPCSARIERLTSQRPRSRRRSCSSKKGQPQRLESFYIEAMKQAGAPKSPEMAFTLRLEGEQDARACDIEQVLLSDEQKRNQHTFVAQGSLEQNSDASTITDGGESPFIDGKGSPSAAFDDSSVLDSGGATARSSCINTARSTTVPTGRSSCTRTSSFCAFASSSTSDPQSPRDLASVSSPCCAQRRPRADTRSSCGTTSMTRSPLCSPLVSPSASPEDEDAAMEQECDDLKLQLPRASSAGLRTSTRHGPVKVDGLQLLLPEEDDVVNRKNPTADSQPPHDPTRRQHGMGNARDTVRMHCHVEDHVVMSSEARLLDCHGPGSPGARSPLSAMSPRSVDNGPTPTVDCGGSDFGGSCAVGGTCVPKASPSTRTAHEHQKNRNVVVEEIGQEQRGAQGPFSSKEAALKGEKQKNSCGPSRLRSLNKGLQTPPVVGSPLISPQGQLEQDQRPDDVLSMSSASTALRPVVLPPQEDPEEADHYAFVRIERLSSGEVVFKFQIETNEGRDDSATLLTEDEEVTGFWSATAHGLRGLPLNSRVIDAWLEEESTLGGWHITEKGLATGNFLSYDIGCNNCQHLVFRFLRDVVKVPDCRTFYSAVPETILERVRLVRQAAAKYAAHPSSAMQQAAAAEPRPIAKIDPLSVSEHPLAWPLGVKGLRDLEDQSDTRRECIANFERFQRRMYEAYQERKDPPLFSQSRDFESKFYL
ncbi:unnamed protein product [Amoebophrya sp. A25]|nr:unnamed protein product [Amoebophrya sp. A25]|eukprot:GSA25T00014226001.1